MSNYPDSLNLLLKLPGVCLEERFGLNKFSVWKLYPAPSALSQLIHLAGGGAPSRHRLFYRSQEGTLGPCPSPKSRLCPPSEDCAPKKVIGSVALECILRPKTPKMVVITPEIVCKNCFFPDFAMRTHFFFVISPPTSLKFAHFVRWRPFLFGLHARVRENLHIFRGEDLLLLLLFFLWSLPPNS